MTEIRTFSPRMTEAWLNAQELHFRETDEGFIVPFGRGELGEPAMMFAISAEGPTGEVLVVRSSFDRQYPLSVRPALQAIADEYNRHFRFVTAITVGDDEAAVVGGDFQVDLGGGTFPAQVGRQLGLAMESSFGLRTWLTEHAAELVEGLVPDQELDADLERLFAGEFDDPAAA